MDISVRCSLYDLFGDLVVYRNLDPVDQRLPRFMEAWADIGLPARPGSAPKSAGSSTKQARDASRPRKHELAYAQTMAWYIRRARALDMPGVRIAELVYVGDTVLSDSNAFRNLRTAGGWRGWAFIGAERDEALAVSDRDDIYTANRWTALADFIAWMLTQRAALDANTAVIVDIDKTALGARGRNDGAIDDARLAAIEATVSETLGSTFDQADFRHAYAELNQARYHSFTADNQDFLAYICLMLGAAVSTLDDLRADIAAGRLTTTEQFMTRIEAQRERLPNRALQALHDEIYTRVKAGDPTPFKAFRRREYRETVTRMGCLPDQVPPEARLVDEICITREVVEASQWLRARGCLLMALSDKPDEATMPSAEAAALGYSPLHRTITHVVGQSIAHLLPAPVDMH